ncbi:hypothetical protein [Legionella yabuuchiae]|uniref:hypothetical protein n=1 Tax=Legionella yabuuchiae TaxID=376727 RepID=UPI001054944E|nr:hypothetical protein [Legionella yabuuchiae]
MNRTSNLVYGCANHGMVFFTTLLMIATLTLLILSLMQGVFLYSKFNTQSLARHEAFYQLESAVSLIASDLTSYARNECVIQDNHPNSAINIIPDKGCSIEREGKVFKFVVSDLGHYECVLIVRNNEHSGSHHWLITASEDSKTVLQIRYATVESQGECQHQPIYLASEGKLSWRLINVNLV